VTPKEECVASIIVQRYAQSVKIYNYQNQEKTTGQEKTNKKTKLEGKKEVLRVILHYFVGVNL